MLISSFNLVHVPATNMEEAGFMNNMVASHQVAILMLWLHLSKAVMLSIFRHSLWFGHVKFLTNITVGSPQELRDRQILEQGDDTM